MYACMCVYVCMYAVCVCMYVCMYVCVCMYICVYMLCIVMYCIVRQLVILVSLGSPVSIKVSSYIMLHLIDLYIFSLLFNLSELCKKLVKINSYGC